MSFRSLLAHVCNALRLHLDVCWGKEAIREDGPLSDPGWLL